MRRREFITLIGGAAAAWPLMARAQQSDRMRRIGVLMPYAPDDPEIESRLTTFRKALEQFGWLEDRNIHIDYRFASGSSGQFLPLVPGIIDARNDV